jgi:pSer/pThr/pTyr-binding forkhead associated (FHA) protein
VHDEPAAETTVALTPEEVEEARVELGDLGVKGPALVVRVGGGLAGEVFEVAGERTTIGRSPDCDVFLDDVTVSRRHALLVHQGSTFVLQDQGSLNGTFLNRSRIESAELADGDEVQIGKYRLTFLT